MTKERLKEIHDSIEFQMQLQQAVGYKSRYDDLLTEEIDLYNEVIDLQERIDKAIEYTNHPWKFECSDEDCNVLIHNRKRFLLGILRGDKE